MKKAAAKLVMVGIVALMAASASATSALDQLKEVSSGTSHTGVTFDGSDEIPRSGMDEKVGG